MVAVFKGCVVCKGRKRRMRNGTGGNTCTANACKIEYKEQRANRSTEQDGAAGDLSTSEKMPDGMSVHELHEILGERCCEQYKLTHKKRKNGPGNSYCQEFLVRGTFTHKATTPMTTRRRTRCQNQTCTGSKRRTSSTRDDRRRSRQNRSDRAP